MNSIGLAPRASRQDSRTGPGSRIIGYWGILLILFALQLGPEATFMFGAVCFGGLLLVWAWAKGERNPDGRFCTCRHTQLDLN